MVSGFRVIRVHSARVPCQGDFFLPLILESAETLVALEFVGALFLLRFSLLSVPLKEVLMPNVVVFTGGACVDIPLILERCFVLEEASFKSSALPLFPFFPVPRHSC